jgi:hypothetical protein
MFGEQSREKVILDRLDQLIYNKEGHRLIVPVFKMFLSKQLKHL